MKILGEWGPFEAAYVRALIICEIPRILGVIRFLIDTGASRTSIMDSDAEILNIKYSGLKSFSPGTIGIGGIVDTFILSNVRLVLRTTEGFHEEQPDHLFVLKHEVKAPEAVERIKKLPSLLGRDILNRYRVVLDRARNEIIITDER